MRRAARRVLCIAVVTSGMGSLPLALPTATAAAVAGSPSDVIPSALVLRGSTTPAAQDTDPPDRGAPTVLRGSPRSAVQPYASPPTCPSGFYYDAALGCVSAPSVAYGPDYDWWPYDWFGYGGFDGGLRRGSRRGFAHAGRRARLFRSGTPTHGGFAHRFAHSIGIAHR